MVVLDGVSQTLRLFDQLAVGDTGFGPVGREVVCVEFEESQTKARRAYDDAFSALSDGSVDALILEEAPAKTLTEAADGWVILDENFSEAELAVGMAKENAGLQQAVNEALADMRDDGTLQSIIERYIPSDPA